MHSQDVTDLHSSYAKCAELKSAQHKAKNVGKLYAEY